MIEERTTQGRVVHAGAIVFNLDDGLSHDAEIRRLLPSAQGGMAARGYFVVRGKINAKERSPTR